MSTDSSPPVLIVGAGPTGLTLALTLTQSGVPVRIIDKNITARPGQRGTSVQARTLELYSIAGVLPAFMEAGARPYPKARFFETGAIEPSSSMHFNEPLAPSPHTPFTHTMGLGQALHEAALRKVLAGYGVQVEFGAELRTIDQDKDGVTVRIEKHVSDAAASTEETARFGYVTGADGARGVVRKLLGLVFKGNPEDDEHHAQLMDVRVEGLTGDFCSMWSTEDKTVGLILISTETPDIYQGGIWGDELGSLPGKENVDMEYLLANRDALALWVEKMIGRDDVKFKELLYVAPYTPRVRIANKFAEGRVFIAGDAAHIHSPVGGQGLNSGVQDAINLGWKLALVTKGLAPTTLLDTYEAERQTVIAYMLNMTSEVFDKMVNKVEDGFARGPHFLMLGVNYRWSPLAIGDGSAEEKKDPAEAETNPYYGGEGLRAGDRAPQAPGLRSAEGAETSFFEAMSLARHTAFVFVGAAAPAELDVGTLLASFPAGTVRKVAVVPQGKLGARVAGAESVLEDVQGHAFEGYKVDAQSGVTVVIVRPDGYIGAIVGGQEGVERYTKVVFGM